MVGMAARSVFLTPCDHEQRAETSDTVDREYPRRTQQDKFPRSSFDFGGRTQIRCLSLITQTHDYDMLS
jgi:hypothetical protein